VQALAEHVYYGDVRVGSIAIRTGNPESTDRWQWYCGFYPGSHPRECTTGTAATFDQAKAAFEAAWRVFSSKRSEADFQAWRNHQARTAEKYRRFDRGERMPHDWWARCPGLTSVQMLAVPHDRSIVRFDREYRNHVETIKTHAAKPVYQKRASIMGHSSVHTVGSSIRKQ
jgi:hypothetical protein